MADRVHINEVGLRDGLQNQPRILATDDKLELLDALLAAGLTSFEAASFVSPRAVPQMADADRFFERLPARDGVSYEALVPNRRGYERARDAGVRTIAVVLGATDSFNRRNINMTLPEAMEVCRSVIATALDDGLRPRAYISMATACPYEGTTPIGRVMDLAQHLFGAGAAEVIVGDSIGAGTPAQIKAIFQPLVRDYGADRLAGHFHDTRGMALAMTWAALEAGIRRFDSSIGGLGGCPFAPGATGNLATEDLTFMLNECGFDTGVDVDLLLAAVDAAERLLDTTLGGAVIRWHRATTTDFAGSSHATGHHNG